MDCPGQFGAPVTGPDELNGKCTKCGRVLSARGTAAYAFVRIPSHSPIEWPENPLESAADRKRRIETFTPWAERGFVVRCA